MKSFKMADQICSMSLNILYIHGYCLSVELAYNLTKGMRGSRKFFQGGSELKVGWGGGGGGYTWTSKSKEKKFPGGVQEIFAIILQCTFNKFSFSSGEEGKRRYARDKWNYTKRQIKTGYMSLNILYQRVLYEWKLSQTGPKEENIYSRQGLYTKNLFELDFSYRKYERKHA